jgi:3-oxoacyl-[acyl-carrier protein] reductase
MADHTDASVRDRVYVILAGGSAIGARVARRLADQGARIALAGRDPDKLQSAATELDGTALRADATSFDDVAQCLKDAAAWGGRVDGVVNCAGSILLKPAHLTTADELQETLALNLVSAFATVRAAVGVMRKEGGSVVLFSSAAAQIGLSNHEAIAAAKAGVIGLTRSAAATYAAMNIRVNAVAPGLTETPLAERITANEGSRNASIAMHPMGRLGRPEDVAEPVCWLLSPASSWVTGQVIGVDGGLATLKVNPTRRG